MKNKKLVISIGIISLIILIILSTFLYYKFSLKSVSHNNEEVTFVVEPLTSKKDIVKNLKSANLIKNDKTLLVYLFFHRDLNLQAGTYLLNRNMSATEIIDKIHRGDIKLDTVTITFYEGKNVNDLIKQISKSFYYSESDIKKVLEDKSFLENLISQYSFLTNDILNDNIYYALEGYLFPDTYTFLEDASVEDIIKRLLDNTKLKLDNLQEQINNSNYTIHELITKASIIELEARTSEERAKISQVIDSRLKSTWAGPLGMDVTTYYAVKKDMNQKLTISDLNTINPYNTRDNRSGMMNNKLPVGPICNPSLDSIVAALNPSATNYEWFVANVCTGEVFFQETPDEFTSKSRELSEICELN